MKNDNIRPIGPGMPARRVQLPNGQALDQAGLEQFLFNRVAPQAIPLEKAVLGALMLDKDAIHLIVDILKEDSFYEDAHNWIYQAIFRLYSKSSPIDLLTVMEELRKMGKLGNVGGPAYLSSLTDFVASAANLEYHSRIIVQFAKIRQAIYAGLHIVKRGYEHNVDALELIDEFQQFAISLSSDIRNKSNSHVSSVAARRAKVLLDGQEGANSIPTGLDALDGIIGGLHAGDLGVLAARPGMGKTAMILGMATSVAIAGKGPVQIFSLEMPEDQLVDRQAAQIAEVEASKIRKGKLDQQEKQALVKAYEQLGELEMYIDDTPGIEIMELRAKAKKAKLQHDIGLIIIDYIQQIEYSGKDAFNREQAVAKIAKELKKLAKELSVPVLALAQLSRAVEVRGGTKRPQLSDLRESGQIEQEADWIGFIYRPEYYQILEDEDGNSLKGIAEVIIAKNRHGELGTAKVKWEKEYTRFSDLGDFDDEAFPAPNTQSISVGDLPATPKCFMIRPSKLNDDLDIPF